MTINKIKERQPAAVPQPQWTTPPPANRWDELSAALQPPAPVERKDQDVFAAMQARAIAAMKKIDAAAAAAAEQAPVEETYAEHLKVCGDCAERELLARQDEIMDGLEAADGVDYNEGAPTAYLNTEGGLMDVKGWDQEMDEENQAAELESIQNHVRERAAAELTPGKKYDIWVSEEGYNWEPQDMDGEALECFSRNLCKLSADDVVDYRERSLFEAHKIINAHNAAIEAEADHAAQEAEEEARITSFQEALMDIGTTPEQYDAYTDWCDAQQVYKIDLATFSRWWGEEHIKIGFPELTSYEEWAREKEAEMEPASAISILQEIARGRSELGLSQC